MSGDVISVALLWSALALILGAVVAAIGAATTRSLFSMCLFLAVCAAFAAAALLALGEGTAALGLTVLGVCIAPFVLLATLLLSSRAIKPRRGSAPWLTIMAACAAGGVMAWALSGAELGAPAYASSAGANASFWLVGLVFVAILSCVGLLGYGERGAFERWIRAEHDE